MLWTSIHNQRTSPPHWRKYCSGSCHASSLSQLLPGHRPSLVFDQVGREASRCPRCFLHNRLGGGGERLRSLVECLNSVKVACQIHWILAFCFAIKTD